ncbi:hydroxyneurosporene dehydrogenase [Roseivivax isoporae LMG 25204]|uniref:Hydroxyneurosporene dehydrogenase n=1 Tax=Roseivivax isoporae LMG 25204 TaxID=1449351 RepID=X7FA82_9RHOB|nr:hydroxyneurosporene dehydrogenase [Roseivivax isoporae LMG 25204]
MFSPWYRWSGRRDPENHVCINVATYGPGGRFAMTDRGRSALRQTGTRFEVGPSRLDWDGRSLRIAIDERGAPPLFGRILGEIRVTPAAVTDVELPLTADGAHVWRPFAPVSGIEVDLDAPGWRWRGHGYLDANFGLRALEADFSYWTWGRYALPGGGTACFYDADRRDGTGLAHGARFLPDGSAEEIALPPRRPMARSLWRVRRETRGDEGSRPRQVRGMLDAPFYARAMVETVLDGQSVTGVHEALDLDRFASPLLKPMIALRVPRRRRWRFGD